MARHYKAVTDHTPIDFENDINAIPSYFEGKTEDFLSIFIKWKLRPLEPDDVEALVDQITRRLIDFALVCDAVPMRTPLKLKATIEKIAKRPADFLANMSSYDPEAVARVYDTLTRGHPEMRHTLALLEVGQGPSPAPEEVTKSASEVLNEFARQNISRRGGQTLVLQRGLVQDLAVIFARFGGSLQQVTQYDAELPTNYSHRGPFHDFLKLVLPPVRPFARKAGFGMKSVRSLASIPDRDNLIKSEEIASLFGEHDTPVQRRAMARVDDFLKLHHKRLKR